MAVPLTQFFSSLSAERSLCYHLFHPLAPVQSPLGHVLSAASLFKEGSPGTAGSGGEAAGLGTEPRLLGEKTHVALSALQMFLVV